MSKITEALEALADGTRTLDEVEAQFRSHDWPRVVPILGDVPQPEGSFEEVADAYSRRQITHDQYVRLAEVVIEVMKQQPDREDQP